jgi:endonuclease/exonuclease/phosphatase family metal-dependent hydrolase
MLETDAASWGHQYSVLLKQDGFPTGITSRYPMEDVQRTIEGFHHGLIRARIRGIYFYNVHLHPSNWQFRIEEVKLILADIRNLPSDANIIIAGDFNTFSPYDSSYYSHHQLEPFFAKRDRENDERNLKEGRLDYTPLQMLNNAGFSDLEYMMRGDRYVFTGSFPTSIEKPGEHGEVRRLDYVFANAGLLDYVHRASIIANDTTQFLSDHLPVIVDLKP